jgi:hypothetical protein
VRIELRRRSRIQVRKETPTGELSAVAGGGGVQEHETDRGVSRQPEGRLEREMDLTMGRKQRAVGRPRSLQVEIEVGLEGILSA